MKKILSTSLTIIFGLWLVVFSSYGIASATGPVYPQSPFTKSGNDILTRNVLDGIGSTTTPLAYLHVDEAHINNYLDFTGVLGSGIDMGNFSITNANLISASYFNATGTSATSTFSGDLIVDGNVGIGTTEPRATLNVVNEIGQSTVYLDSFSDSSGNESSIRVSRARGTFSSPSIIQEGDDLGSLIFTGYNTSFVTGASIFGVADAEWGTAGDTTDNPTYLDFRTVPDGGSSAMTRMVIKSNGRVGIATSTPAMELDVAGMMRAYKTSTSTCDATLYGAIFYHQTDDIFWGCKSSGWSRLDN